MKNISFDNPYLLLIAIPLLLALFIPFFITFKKENRTKGVVASLALHTVMICLIALSVAGMALSANITKTEVYVMADVSRSTKNNLDKIDEYIENIKETLPSNSQLGVVCFGKDYKLTTPLGGELTSVKESGVSDSASNINEALIYTSTLFNDDALKRIVIVSDGKETNPDGTRDLISTIESLYARKIYVDAMYLDSNISENEDEIQISSVDFTKSTYLNHEATADVLIQSNKDSEIILELARDDEVIKSLSVALTKGYNVANFDLDTSSEGENEYTIKIKETKSLKDTSRKNNTYSFTQSVLGKLSVLLISSDKAEAQRAIELYGENAIIDSYVGDKNIPYTIEQLCKYDEILLCNVDLTALENYEAFLNSVNLAVSQFGKSLVTIGDTQIQNKSDGSLDLLDQMLPVRFGNDVNDPKLYCIVIDSSRSMNNFSHFVMAKRAAIQLMNMLNPEDYVMVVSFSGDVSITQPPTPVSSKDKVAQAIEGIKPTQGTVIGAALNAAYLQIVAQPFYDKQLMLISDGLSYGGEVYDPIEVTTNLKNAGVVVSTLYTGRAGEGGEKTMKNIAGRGKGSFYPAETEKDLEDLLLSDIADDVTDTVVNKESNITIAEKTDLIVEDIELLNPLHGYIFSKARTNATTVLTTEYVKKSGALVTVPIYAYRELGNGRVASFTSSLSGDWTKEWSENEELLFLGRILKTNTPKEKTDFPYDLNISFDGSYSSVEIIPVELNPEATVSIEIKTPLGDKLSYELTYDSTRYFKKFEAKELGKYEIVITYSSPDLPAADNPIITKSTFNISYSPEYDEFVIFDPSMLNSAIRNRGSVNTDGSFVIDNEGKEVTSFKLSFTVPFMVLAVILFIIDIIVRKIRWADIKSLFKKKARDTEANYEK